MSGHDRASFMLSRAEDDFADLKRMLGAGGFTEANFGFRAQQAVEKALKAWLIALDVAPPRTHDLGALMRLIQTENHEIDPHRDLVDLNPFAVEFRYDPMPADLEPLNRATLVQDVEGLVAHVRSIIDAASGEPD